MTVIATKIIGKHGQVSFLLVRDGRVRLASGNGSDQELTSIFGDSADEFEASAERAHSSGDLLRITKNFARKGCAVEPFGPPAAHRSDGTTPLTERQEGTLLAALRLWQGLLAGNLTIAGEPVERLLAVASNNGSLDPLSNEEVEILIEEVLRL